jgi:DNA-binding winged helix-turn-helix (wHTH) protein/tetratricopeptide (TPR) repeat protein
LSHCKSKPVLTRVVSNVRYRLKDWEVNPDLNTVSQGSKTTRIEPLAMDVLVYLLEHKGMVVSTSELLAKVWKGRPLHPAAVKKRINQLRRSLQDSTENPTYIATINKRGYCLIASASKIEAAKHDDSVESDESSESSQSIAVLTLKDTSELKSRYLAEAFTEELVTSLAKMSGLSVAPQSAVRRLIDRKTDFLRLAQSLDVRYLLEGSIASRDGELQLNLRIVDTVSDNICWANSYQSTESNLLNLCQNLAIKIAQGLGVETVRTDYQAPSRETNTAALQAYLRAVAAMGVSENFGEWYDTAKLNLEQSVVADKNFADAWGRLALIETVNGVWLDRSAFQKARDYAQTSLKLNTLNPTAFTVLGYTKMLDDWNPDGAEKLFTRAISCSPYDPTAMQGYMTCLRVQGNEAEALKLSKSIVTRSPGDLGARAERIKVLYSARCYEDVLFESKMIRELDADYYGLEEAIALMRLGRFADSAACFIRAYRFAGVDVPESLMTKNLSFEEVLRKLLTRSEYGEIKERSFLILAQLGEIDAAFAALEHQLLNGSPWLVGIRTHPDFDQLRGHWRFEQLLESVALPPLPPSSSMQVDLKRIMVLSGHGARATTNAEESPSLSPTNHMELRWIDTLAWLDFAEERYGDVLNRVDEILNQTHDSYTSTFAYLLRSASLMKLNDEHAARTSFRQASSSWPDELILERDVKPLFLGGDQRLAERYLGALEKLT